MEAFSLLKYWKAAGAGDGCGGCAPVALEGCSAAVPVPSSGDATPTTILTSDDFDSDGDAGVENDEGPFFDLEFAVPEEEDEEESRKLERENGKIVGDEEVEEYDEDVEEVRELKLRPSSSTPSCEHSDGNVDSLSPSDEVLFKGQMSQFDSSEEEEEEEVNSKSGQFPMPVSLLRSATKFPVFMLKLKRPKTDSATTTTTTTTKSQLQKQNQQQSNRKLFTVKFKVEEVPVISLLSRASSNSKTNTTAISPTSAVGEEQPAADSADEKRNKKEVMQKYLKLVKPLYIRVSKRSQQPVETTEKMEEAKEESPEVKETAAVEKGEIKGQKAVVGLNLKGMMMAKKHLGKSKSAVVHSTMQNAASNRRDDSLLELQDGIQGAILHCKRSFNSSTPDVEEREESEAMSVLKRSASDPSHEKKRTTALLATELTGVEEKPNDVLCE